LAADEQEPRRAQRAALQTAREGEIAVTCECSDSSCHELIVLTREEHDFIRKVPNRLVVMPGHADPKSERVLMAEPERFEVVEPFGQGAS
jgi:hypothetical protein